MPRRAVCVAASGDVNKIKVGDHITSGAWWWQSLSRSSKHFSAHCKSLSFVRKTTVPTSHCLGSQHK